MTSIEWLEKSFNDPYKNRPFITKEEFEQAKEMHRKETIVAFEMGRFNIDDMGCDEEPKQENCCTPIGQIKRYVDCIGCDRKPKQETTLEEAAGWLNKKFNGKGVEVKIIDWGKNKMYNYNPTKLLEEYSKWQEERMYSEEEVRLMLSESFKASQEGYDITTDDIIKQFKKD
jgi:hypothetical protein